MVAVSGGFARAGPAGNRAGSIRTWGWGGKRRSEQSLTSDTDITGEGLTGGLVMGSILCPLEFEVSVGLPATDVCVLEKVCRP